MNTRDYAKALRQAPQEFAAQARAEAIKLFRETRQKIADAAKARSGTAAKIETRVDGVVSEQLDSARTVLLARFDYGTEVAEAALKLLGMASPRDRKAGAPAPVYAESHTIFVDGDRVQNLAERPFGREIIITNLAPYARRLEYGSSKAQAPNGVYQIVAEALKLQKYRYLAHIEFNFSGVANGQLLGGRAGNVSGDRWPSLIIRPKWQ